MIVEIDIGASATLRDRSPDEFDRAAILKTRLSRENPSELAARIPELLVLSLSSLFCVIEKALHRALGAECTVLLIDRKSVCPDIIVILPCAGVARKSRRLSPVIDLGRLRSGKYRTVRVSERCRARRFYSGYNRSY